MSLRKKDGRNVWMMRFRQGKRIREISTGCTNKNDARVVEMAFMMKMRMQKVAHKLGIDVDMTPAPALQENRVRLVDMIGIAGKYREMKKEQKMYWSVFCEKSGIRYADELDVKVAMDFLQLYSSKAPKTYNNVKTALNTVCKLCIAETGMESPFAKILPKLADSEHHRPFTDAEIDLLMANATPFWRYMITISKETGMPKEMCLRFCPAMVENKNGILWAKYLRAKTKRFGRYTQVPLRKAVLDLIQDKLSASDKEKPFCDYYEHSKSDKSLSNQFHRLMEQCGIQSTENAIVNFHSLRSNFVTMCDAMNLDRHTTRGMVGHTADSTTDLYSADEVTPLEILDYPTKNETKK